MVGPPASVPTLAQHIAFVDECVDALVLQSGIRPWAEVYSKHRGEIAMYFANLPGNRWAIGDSKLQEFRRLKRMAPWKKLATNRSQQSGNLIFKSSLPTLRNVAFVPCQNIIFPKHISQVTSMWENEERHVDQ